MVILRLSIQARSCPMARKDKLWSFCALLSSRDDHARWHAETNYGHPHAFAICKTRCLINAQRQIMIILRSLSFRSSESSGGRRQIMVIPHTFSPSKGDRVRWHAETKYGHSAPFHPGPIVSDGTQRQIMVILRLVSTKRNEFGSIRMVLVVWCWSFSKFLQVLLAGRLTGRMVFRSNEISVLSLLPFYLQ